MPTEDQEHLTDPRKFKLAVMEGSIDNIKKFLQAGVQVNTRYEYGRTALMIAIESGSVDVIKVLLNTEGVDINIQDHYGNNALMLAATMGNVDAIRELLGKGVDVNITNNAGSTALMIAASYGHVDAIRELLQAEKVDINIRDNEGNNALMLALSYGHVDVFRELLLTKRLELNIQNNNGNNALMIAANDGNVDMIKELLNKGVNVDIHNTYNWTALIIAASYGHVDAIKELLNAGAAIDLTDKEGSTALIIAASYGHVDAMKELLNAGAAIDLTDKEGSTALMMAASYGHVDAMKALLNANKVDVNIQDNNGDTALMLAIKSPYATKDSVEALLKKPVNLGIRNNSGQDALEIAGIAKNEEILVAIVKKLLTSPQECDMLQDNILTYLSNDKFKLAFETALKELKQDFNRMFVALRSSKTPSTSSMFGNLGFYVSDFVAVGEVGSYAYKLFDYYQKLHTAIQKDNLIKLSELLKEENYINVLNVINVNTNYIFRRALLDGSIEVVTEFFNKYPQLFDSDGGKNYLFKAVEKKHSPIISFFLHNPKIKTEVKQEALMLAVKGEDLATVRCFFEPPLTWDPSIIQKAIKSNNNQNINNFLNAQVPPTHLDTLSAQFTDLNSKVLPVSNHLQTIRQLLRKRDITTTNNNQLDNLRREFEAISDTNNEKVKGIIRKLKYVPGLTPDVQNNFLLTLLSHAVQNKNLRIIKILLQENTIPLQVKKDALRQAVQGGHLPTVRCFFDSSIQVNLSDASITGIMDKLKNTSPIHKFLSTQIVQLQQPKKGTKKLG